VGDIGRLLIVAGAVLVIVGAFFALGGRVPFLGRLPGDISFKSGNVQVYFPLVTCLLLSAVLTLVLNFFFRGR
jgi:K+ transporter